MLCFSKAEFYSYELILKSKTNDYIKNFDESATRVSHNDGVKHSTTYYSRDVTNKVHQWELKDGLERCWKEIEEANGFKEWFKLAKPHVKEFKLFLIEIPHLPYDLILIKTILNENSIQNVASSNDQLNIMASVNSFMERFHGIIKDLNYGDKFRPCYLKLHVNTDETEMKAKLDKIKILHQNKDLDNNDKIGKYYEGSKSLRIRHFDPSDIAYKMMSVFTKGNSVSVMGLLEGFTNEMNYTNYEISFSSNEKNLMWTMHTFFNNEIDYDFSTYIHFVSISLFLTYILRKLDEYEVKFDGLASEYRTLDEKNPEKKKELYDKLSKFEDELYFFKLDLEKIDFVLKNPLENTMRMISNYNLTSPKQREEGKMWSAGMLEAIFMNNKNGLKQISGDLTILMKKGADFKNKFEKDIVFENTLSMNKYSERNQWLTVAILTLSAIVAGQIIYNIFMSTR